MGWDTTFDAGPTKPFLIADMEQAGRDGVPLYRVLDYAQVGWSAVFMAVECLTDFPYGKGKVFATVTLIRRSRDGSLTKKDMSETMGPAEDRCPLRILAKLSPIDEMYGPVTFAPACDKHYRCDWEKARDEEHVNQRQVRDNAAGIATDWREAVRAYHAKPKPKLGQHVRFGSPIRFTNGDELTDFEYLKGSTFRRPGGLSKYQITGWKNLSFEVLA